MTRRNRTPRLTAQSELLSATGAAELLGIGRTRFWQLRKEIDLKPVPWARASRPLYRRADILALAGEPQGEVSEIAPESVAPSERAPVALPDKGVKLHDPAGFDVKPVDTTVPFKWPVLSDDFDWPPK
ncbi:hypothetical protein [Neorhizobium galegae]|uniref:hypothetical protein n=1 Tax=Neorhizobium galegae TaxID=399 RepID=UPI00062129CA|nr:hypothetical protein [Neorhizobium galegae]KAB1126318.1 hypothetical protein F4V90_04170 [Neorhizobium galegae]MCQ1805289.1 hypothetical protein [Neorhizobium galegae]CDZ56051.1 Hypothetical protein NGAL_HAMBI2566_06010 [Neorhizobium galegae bv. orientalis]